jgi:hypothetical protein
VLDYAAPMDVARAAVPGLVVRYEDLCEDPVAVTQEVEMLDYGEADHGPFKSGIGDWSQRIRSGQIPPPRPLPDAESTPDGLLEQARAWGYL